jgi:hypothetical protein
MWCHPLSIPGVKVPPAALARRHTTVVAGPACVTTRKPCRSAIDTRTDASLPLQAGGLGGAGYRRPLWPLARLDKGTTR